MIKEMYDEYVNSKNKILQYFGEDALLDEIEFLDDVYWKVDAYDIHFSYEEVDNIEDCVYSEEIYNVYRKEEYTMIRINSCTGGNSYLAIFNNSKEIK